MNIVRFSSEQEALMRWEADKRKYDEMRWTHVITYDDGESIIIGGRRAPTVEEMVFDRDRGMV